MGKFQLFVEKVIRVFKGTPKNTCRATSWEANLGRTEVVGTKPPVITSLETGILKKQVAETRTILGGGEVTRSYAKCNIFEPAPESNLGKLGVTEVRAKITPDVNNIIAKVKINGKEAYLNREQLRNYRNMMNKDSANSLHFNSMPL